MQLSPTGLTQSQYDELRAKLSDRDWRLSHLYFIEDKDGQKVLFKPNRVQWLFYKRLWYFNVILKARQLGLSTFILIYILDAILFNKNKKAGVIAQGLSEASDLFKNKVKFAYDNLPDAVKLMVTAVQDSAGSMTFSNGSSIKVGTSLRGGTFQYLHVSEYGKIAAKYPDKAREIKTGALNTVATGQQIFIESTAEGQEGEFYDLVQRAKKLEEMGTVLTPLDPRFHFFPWYEDEGYRLETPVPITPDMQKYFAMVEAENGITLSLEQKYWYVKKRESQGEDMLREFPSTPTESFQTSLEGVYFNKELADLRKQGRIGDIPWNPAKPVFTWWDLGFNDDTTITFTQENGGGHDVIDYYENNLEGLPHYVNIVRNKPYTYAEHNWPHDGVNTDWSTGEKRNVTAVKLGLKPLKLVDRSKDLRDDHEKVRNILPACRFDAIKCDKLLKHLGSYRKEWNDKLGVWRDNPRHDEASHGVASFRTFATGYRKKTVSKPVERQLEDWRN